MRDVLKEREGVRARFTATFSRFGVKPATKFAPAMKTLLLTDVRDGAGGLVTDHLWFKAGVWSNELDPRPGDRIAFDSRVMKYEKGYRGRRGDDDLPAPAVDYRLGFPTRAAKLPAAQPTATPAPASPEGLSAPAQGLLFTEDVPNG